MCSAFYSVRLSRILLPDLCNKVAHATGNQKWWNWRGEILVFWDFIYDSKKIGIESKFTEVDNTFSSFEIKITTWDVEALKFYKEDLKIILIFLLYKKLFLKYEKISVSIT